MTEPVFSEREGFAPHPEPQSYNYLPAWAREALTNAIREFAQSGAPVPGSYRLSIYPLFKPYIWKVLGTKPPGSPMDGPFHYYIPKVLEQCNWYQFYDILEEVCHLINQQLGHEDSEDFSGRVNAILARDGIPWKLEQCKVVRKFNPHITEQIKEVGILLHAPKFKGPDEQFAKSVEHLNKRPAPDEENCVKDAVGAVEAVANIIAGTNGVQLNKLLDKGPFRSSIPATIRESINKVYAYRGAAPGVGHAQIGPAVVGQEEAMWVLTVSAATILYLVTKFSKPAA